MSKITITSRGVELNGDVETLSGLLLTASKTNNQFKMALLLSVATLLPDTKIIVSPIIKQLLHESDKNNLF